jgi:hypothetical protein
MTTHSAHPGKQHATPNAHSMPQTPTAHLAYNRTHLAYNCAHLAYNCAPIFFGRGPRNRRHDVVRPAGAARRTHMPTPTHARTRTPAGASTRHTPNYARHFLLGARFDDGAGGDNEVQRTMLEIVNQLDGFEARGNVKVLMATNRCVRPKKKAQRAARNPQRAACNKPRAA